MAAPRQTSDGSLSAYRRRRRFDRTPEPRGRKAGHGGNSYVVQKHSARRLHYDFRLELDGVLKSWAVTRGPSLDPAQKRLAVRTEDHPVEYGSFEGTIPEGQYGAGTVMLWDRGTWEPIGDPHQGLRKGKLVFRLNGERLRGRWALIRFKDGSRGDAGRENWLLIKEADEQADRRRDVLNTFQTSVATGRNFDEIAAQAPAKTRKPKSETEAGRRGAASDPPAFVKPELATLVDAVPNGEGWIFETKFDGYRALLAASGGRVRIYTRSGLDWTHRFAPLADAAGKLDLHGVLLDGEIAVLDAQGRSNFAALQQALKGQGGELSYFAFDLLFEEGRDLRPLPLVGRKEQLRALLGEAGRTGPIFFTDHIEGDGEAVLQELCRRGFEGVVAKRTESLYRAGRTRDWLKIKCAHQQEFVIVGWSPSARGRPFSSILLGVREGKALRYAGRVGSGFSRSKLQDLARRFAKLERKTTPVLGAIPSSLRRSARWVEPKLVAEIAFAGFTADGLVRQGRFLGLREDKPAGEVRWEEALPLEEAVMPKERKDRKAGSKGRSGSAISRAGTAAVVAGVRLSSPDKLLYEEQGLTKLDMARYLERVAPVMLPHVANRLLTLVRCPDGNLGECFYQRHIGSALPKTFRLLAVNGGARTSDKYIYITDTAGLISTAQVGTLEIHVWGSRVDDVERPDRMVFDLDPGEGVPFGEVKRAAEDLRVALRALELESFAMLTGGKGVHVIVPMTRRYTWPVVKAFARAAVERLAGKAPDRFVTNMSKAKRSGKIFLDYLRNDRTATAIAPFSPRARRGAPVAWPVEWSDLSAFDIAAAVTVRDVLDGKRQPAVWKGYDLRQQIKASALKALGVGES